MRIHREHGSVRIELGRLWLIRCARYPSGRRTLDHPNAWMLVWRRKLPEWNPATKWQGSEEPGPYWRGCDSRLKGKDDYGHFARCLFPDCDCWRRLPRKENALTIKPHQTFGWGKSKSEGFVCYFHFISFWHWSLGLSFWPIGPNIEIHLPFGFIDLDLRVAQLMLKKCRILKLSRGTSMP